MENISGYARVLARTRVDQQSNKNFFGKTYIKYGQCWILWAYLFQLGGILAAKHSTKLDAFGLAFLGMQGKPGAIKLFFTEVANNNLTNLLNDSVTFSDYVGKEFLSRSGNTDDAMDFFLNHGMEKIKPKQAEELAWQYAEQGSAIGAIYPDIIQKMFKQTHSNIPKEKWDIAYKAGLNISPEQDHMSYEEVEDGEDEVFMDYCVECCPDLHSILTG